MDEQYGQLIEPQKVPFEFGAPGWYVLGILLLLALAAIIWLVAWYIKKNRYRNAALKALAAAEATYASSDPMILVYETNMVLKRIAMTRYKRNETAGLRGNTWIDFLNKSSRSQLFNETDDKLLHTGIYSHNESDTASFIIKAKQWIKKHKRMSA